MGAVTEKFIARQVRRMSGLDRYPDQDGQMELCTALFEACNSDDHAKRVVDDVMREFEECPKPAKLRAMAAETAEPAKLGCTACIEGWRYETVNGAGGVRPCECRRKGAAA